LVNPVLAAGSISGKNDQMRFNANKIEMTVKDNLRECQTMIGLR
jgi:azurin